MDEYNGPDGIINRSIGAPGYGILEVQPGLIGSPEPSIDPVCVFRKNTRSIQLGKQPREPRHLRLKTGRITEIKIKPGVRRHIIFNTRQNRRGYFDAVDEIAVGIECLQKATDVDHPRIGRIFSPRYEIKGRHRFLYRGGTEGNTPQGKRDCLPAEIVERTTLIGYPRETVGLVRKPRNRTIHKCPRCRRLPRAASSSATGEKRKPHHQDNQETGVAGPLEQCCSHLFHDD